MTLMLGLSAFTTYTVVTTSLQSNLFKEWDYLASIPWMVATIRDFYAMLTIIAVWIIYKEGWLKGLLWVLACVTLGSMATPIYVFLQLKKLKPGDPIEKALLR